MEKLLGTLFGIGETRKLIIIITKHLYMLKILLSYVNDYHNATTKFVIVSCDISAETFGGSGMEGTTNWVGQDQY